MLKMSPKRIRKYLNGDPYNLCIYGARNKKYGSMLDEYKEIILTLLSEEIKYKDIFDILLSKGYKGKYSILCRYCKNYKEIYGLETKVQLIERKYINRQDIIKYIWSRKEMD